jgi:hypothetical protein
MVNQPVGQTSVCLLRYIQHHASGNASAGMGTHPK